MTKWLNKPVLAPAALLLANFLPILLALVQVVQIPTGGLPEDSQRLTTTPILHFLHVAAGATFGILGPIQFGLGLAHSYGFLHRLFGRLFVASGAAISLTSLALLVTFPEAYSAAISSARLIFGIALGAALIIAVKAIRKGNIARHRNWMIRAYAIGMGATAVSMIFFPVYLVTGEAPTGAVADVAFCGAWLGCILFAEYLVRRS